MNDSGLCLLTGDDGHAAEKAATVVSKSFPNLTLDAELSQNPPGRSRQSGVCQDILWNGSMHGTPSPIIKKR